MKTCDNVPVLIVDDRPENLISLEALLSDMDLDLVKALSGDEALRRSLHTEFALVLLDVQMPGMDGFETAELMRQNARTRQVPIIFITAGMNEEHHLFKGYQAGGVDYLTKPFEPLFLRNKVKVFCDLFSQRRQLERMQAISEKQNANLREETARRLQAMEELRQKDQMMIQQSRLAAMGEMLNNIAHQWRQPLNVLGLMIQEIGLCYAHDECNTEQLNANIEKMMEIIGHMSQTIDDFRDFSSPDKERSLFSVESVVAKTLSLIEDTFRHAGIAVESTASGHPHIEGYPNEYRQVLLNILKNAIDAFGEQTTERRITLRSWTENGRAVVTITDNAGGIKEEIIDKVFDAYYTTKALGKGTGVGLFISKNIIENNMGGRLSVRNVEGGAEFRIEV